MIFTVIFEISAIDLVGEPFTFRTVAQVLSIRMLISWHSNHGCMTLRVFMSCHCTSHYNWLLTVHAGYTAGTVFNCTQELCVCKHGTSSPTSA